LKSNKLKIGRIPYANLFPIFHYLEKDCNSAGYKFVKGVPSKLNKMLRDGELDISASSSIEFLMNKDKYRILPWSSISSEGTIRSILLFSKFPIHELNRKEIALSSESETSIVLLKIILREFLSLQCKFTSVNHRSISTTLSSFSAVLHIGDTAMREAKKVEAGAGNGSIHIYDLGELWDEYAGCPFVFALWIARKESVEHKKELFSRLSSDLINAKKYICKQFPLIARHAPQKEWLSEKELVDYWKMISYDFTEKHLEGLRLFEKYAKEHRIY